MPRIGAAPDVFGLQTTKREMSQVWNMCIFWGLWAIALYWAKDMPEYICGPDIADTSWLSGSLLGRRKVRSLGASKQAWGRGVPMSQCHHHAEASRESLLQKAANASRQDDQARRHHPALGISHVGEGRVGTWPQRPQQASTRWKPAPGLTGLPLLVGPATVTLSAPHGPSPEGGHCSPVGELLTLEPLPLEGSQSVAI